MQVNSGPVSQDGHAPSSQTILGRPYETKFDPKTMAIDSQLLQSAHPEEQAQALAAAAAHQSDRSTEYAIQQLQGYSGIKEDIHALAHAGQHHTGHAGGRGHAGSHAGNHVAHQGNSHVSHQGHPGHVTHQGHPGQLAHSHDASTPGVPSMSNINHYVNPQAQALVPPKPAVGSEEYYRIKKYNHKEVERRRRETINKGIDDLGKVVPDCDKHKGQILARAVDYIKLLKDKEETLMKQLTLEKLISEQSINELSSTNKSLKAELGQAWKDLEHYKRQARAD